MTDDHKTIKTFQAPDKDEKEFAALSYLWIFSVLVYFSPHAKSEFVRHHAKQAMVLFLLSIFIYFLPGYFVFLNFLVLFLMVLGVVESALGNWYFLPIVGSWVQGQFHPQKHFSFFIFWFQRFISLFSKKTKVIVPAENIQEKLSKDPRPYWKSSVVNIEKSLREILSHEAVEVHQSETGFSVFLRGAEVFYFGGVEGDTFIFIYAKHLLISEETKDWVFRKYDADHFDLSSFQALAQLLFRL